MTNRYHQKDGRDRPQLSQEDFPSSSKIKCVGFSSLYDGPKMAQMSPDGPKTTHNCPRCTKDGSRWCRDYPSSGHHRCLIGTSVGPKPGVGLPNEGRIYSGGPKIGFSILLHGFEFLKGYFDKPLPPKGRPRPPATFTGRFSLIVRLDPLPS